MCCNNDFRQDGFPTDIDINITNQNANMNTNTNTNMMGYNQPMTGSYNSPMVETPQERVVHRNFVHEVPHVCPINTRIINHHIYRHTYQPRYTCCEENVVTNEQCGSCCQFK